MGRLLGRSQMRAAASLLVAALPLAACSLRAKAQDGEEVISDPELVGTPAPAAGAADDSGDEVIMDPELGDTGSSTPTTTDWSAGFQDAEASKPTASDAPAEEEDEYDPLANTGMAKLELLGQVAADLHHEGQLEDAYETRLRFGGEIEFRRSRNLRLVVGSRLDFFWAVPSQDDNIVVASKQRALDQDRFEVDVIPTAAFADMSLFDGFHLRVGEQVVSLGRMDFYSPTDSLVIYDMRPQPRLDPASAKLAQPAIRIDWDITTSLTLQAAYVPWFSPNLTRPNRDKYVAEVTGGRGAAKAPDYGSDYIDPSFQTKQSEANVRFIGPPPDFKTPQVAARLVYRGSSFDFAASASSALEKIPSVYLTPAAAELAASGPDASQWSPQTVALLQQIQGSPAAVRLADVEFHRYAMIGGDFGFDLGPVSLGFEGAFSPERHLYAATKDGKHIAQPNTTKEITDPCFDGQTGCVAPKGIKPSNVSDRSIRKGVPVVQGAVHAEWLKGDTLIVATEAFWINALELPYDQTRDWAGFIPNTGAYVGGMANASYLLNEGQWRFEGTVIVTAVGPSIVAIPHIEVRAREGLFIDCGAQLFEGPAPGYKDKMGRMSVVGAQNASLGGLLTGYDQVFVGIRWLP